MLAKITADLTSEAFIKSIIEQAHASQHPKRLQAELATIQTRIDSMTRKCAVLSNLIPETTAKRPLLAKLEEMEKEREALWSKASALKIELDGARVVTLLQPAQVRQLLSGLATNLVLSCIN